MSTVAVAALAIVMTVVGGLLGLIYREQKTAMWRHEKLDDDRFAGIRSDTERHHADNLAQFRALNKASGRLSGALIMALSSNATPEERRDMIRILMELEG